jgi:hypothetical protein
MPPLANSMRAELLELLKLGAGQAESSTAPAMEIYPIAEHIRAIEPGVVLIVGDRGSGKTQLKNALTDERLRGALLRHSSTVRSQNGPATWYTGWPLLAAGPDPLSWRTLAQNHRDSREDMMVVWLAYFLRTIAPHLVPDEALRQLIAAPAINAEQCLTVCRRYDQQLIAAVDQLDARLQAEDRWIVVAYDELDVVVVDDWEALGTIIRGLVTLWVTYARRWQRIRPKIFLRTDFYRHHREIAGADVAKLASNRVELAWSDKNLYGALIKHIVNKDERLRQHFASSVVLAEDADLGWIPKLATADDARGFVLRLVGEYMGANPKKGEAFTWILDHLRDGNDRALPRTLIWLTEFAAERELADMRAKGARLFHHVSLRNALDRVSEQYVQHSGTHEFRWIPGLKQRLAHDRGVPWTRKELERLIARDFNGDWSNGSIEVRPPGINYGEVLENLATLGVFRVRSKVSYDVPDLYLSGLGLSRRGGVAKE